MDPLRTCDVGAIERLALARRGIDIQGLDIPRLLPADRAHDGRDDGDGARRRTRRTCGTWHRVLTDPARGAVLDPSEPGSFRWRLPSGYEYDVEPHDAREPRVRTRDRLLNPVGSRLEQRLERLLSLR
jgi:hypothetical protein